MSWMLPYKTPAMQALREATARPPIRLWGPGVKGRTNGRRGGAGRMAKRFADALAMRKATA